MDDFVVDRIKILPPVSDTIDLSDTKTKMIEK